MIIDGLWVGEWHSNVKNIRVGTGVIVFHQGRVFGGNDRVYLVGEVRSGGHELDADIRMTYYAGEPLGIFGLLDLDQTEEVHVKGTFYSDEMNIEGTVKSDRMVRLHGTLRRKATL